MLCPHVLKFDVTNSIHIDFIIATSNLLAYIYFIEQIHNREYITEEVSKIQAEEFYPKSYDEIDQQSSSNSLEIMNQILDYLSHNDDIQIREHEFEIDNNTNFHMDYIVATANLRAENYNIQMADRNKVKRIAGNINPSIVTTTAMIAGFVCLEVYKLIQNYSNIELYRDTFVNLGISCFTLFEPTPPKQQKVYTKEEIFSSQIVSVEFFSILIINLHYGIELM